MAKKKLDFHRLWRGAVARARARYGPPAGTWGDGECMIYGHGYEDGYRAALRRAKPARKPAKKKA